MLSPSPRAPSTSPRLSVDVSKAQRAKDLLRPRGESSDIPARGGSECRRKQPNQPGARSDRITASEQVRPHFRQYVRQARVSAAECDSHSNTPGHGIITRMDSHWEPGLDDPFEAAIDEALSTLPADFRAEVSNVAIVVEDEPPDGRLLGRYSGVPRVARGRVFGPGGMLPESASFADQSRDSLPATQNDYATRSKTSCSVSWRITSRLSESHSRRRSPRAGPLGVFRRGVQRPELPDGRSVSGHSGRRPVDDSGQQRKIAQ